MSFSSFSYVLRCSFYISSFSSLFGHFFEDSWLEAYTAQSVARLASGTGNLMASALLRTSHCFLSSSCLLHTHYPLVVLSFTYSLCLAIVARVEFDVDRRRARWYDSFITPNETIAVSRPRPSRPDSEPRTSPFAGEATQRRMTLLDSLDGPEPRHSARSFANDPATRWSIPSATRLASSPASRSEYLSKQTSPSERRSFLRRGISPSVTEASEGDPDDDSGYISDRNSSTRKKNVAPLTTYSPVPLRRGVTGPIDPVHDFDESWPPTPDSPDRLPSPTLPDRVRPFTPPPEGLESAPYIPIPKGTFATKSSYGGFERRPPPLIEADYTIKMVPLSELHRSPSPTSSSFSVEHLDFSDPPPTSIILFGPLLSYPYSLASIYPSRYPHFDLYPSVKVAVPKPTEYTAPSPTSTILLGPVSSYPFSIASIYPSQYPHFDLYPSVTVAVPRPTEYTSPSPSSTILLGPISSYPFSLASIYPSRYPHFDLYPSVTVAVPRPIEYTAEYLNPQPSKTAGYPYSLAELYPACYPPVPFPALVPSVSRPVDYTSASYLNPWFCPEYVIFHSSVRGILADGPQSNIPTVSFQNISRRISFARTISCIDTKST
jgi:hypothetical protein